MAELKKKLEDAQKEVGLRISQLEESNKRLIDYKAKRKDDMDAAEQKWYDYCFEV